MTWEQLGEKQQKKFRKTIDIVVQRRLMASKGTLTCHRCGEKFAATQQRHLVYFNSDRESSPVIEFLCPDEEIDGEMPEYDKCAICGRWIPLDAEFWTTPDQKRAYNVDFQVCRACAEERGNTDDG